MPFSTRARAPVAAEEIPVGAARTLFNPFRVDVICRSAFPGVCTPGCPVPPLWGGFPRVAVASQACDPLGWIPECCCCRSRDPEGSNIQARGANPGTIVSATEFNHERSDTGLAGRRGHHASPCLNRSKYESEEPGGRASEDASPEFAACASGSPCTDLRSWQGEGQSH